MDNIDKLKKTADSGDKSAIIELFEYYLKVNEVDKAYDFIKHSISNVKDIDFKGFLEYIYVLNCISIKNHDDMMLYLKKSVKHKNDCANFLMGLAYYKGEYGLSKDIIKSIYHLSFSAFKENLNAFNYLMGILEQIIIENNQNMKCEIKDYIDNNINIYIDSYKNGSYKALLILTKLLVLSYNKEYAKDYIRNIVKMKYIIKFILKKIKNRFKKEVFYIKNCGVDDY